MSPSYRKLVGAARASYPVDKRHSEATTDLPSMFVYRPVSFWVTPLFIAYGMSPNGVTLLGFACAVAMPVAAGLGGGVGAALVVALALTFHVLDSVDGNVARMTGRTSAAGQFLDGLTSLVFWAAYLVAVGVLARGVSGGFVSRHALEIGLGLALMLLLQRELEDSYDAVFGERVRWGPYLPPGADGGGLTKIGRVVEHVYAFGGLLGAGLFGALDVFLAIVAVWQGVLFVTWLPKFAIAVRKRL